MKTRVLRYMAMAVIILTVGAMLITLAGADPLKAARAFMLGVAGTANGFAEIFVKATPLILTGLGVALCAQTGFFNIGGEGQFYMGALAATITALKLPWLAGPVRIVACMLAACAAGGIWALMPAFMKNKLCISETVTTIMFNYIAIMVVGILVRGWLQEEGSALPQTAAIDETCRLICLWPPTRLHFGFIIAILCAVAVWFLLNRTTIGFEMRMVGYNQRAAYCMGFPVSKCLLLSAILGGGLAGIAGMSEVLGIQFKLLEGISSGVGYTAVLIALLAGNKPLHIVAISLLYSAFQTGANTMQRQLGVPAAIVQIITGLVVLMMLVQSLQMVKRAKKQGGAI